MNINDKLHGFTVIRTEALPEADSVLTELSHDETGARVVWLNNSEENKVFSIAFKTPPTDDTGVFHILEHSVLEGSEKYPVKESFLELVKSSMSTFLNAMTYPDKTLFPISSRNDSDFMNLTRVYLDAVFRPLIYTNPNIFYQEGWHTELRSAEDNPIYKGVVFNEMKGAYSSIDNRIETEMNKLLFPDSCYRYDSGGDPVHIPDLTYESFLERHRRYYHPSNAYIFLDGPVDIDAVLELTDEYISGAGRCGELPEIVPQKPVSSAERECFYDIAPDENEIDRTHFVTGKILCSWNDREKLAALGVLSEVLTGSNDSPLKRALLDTGLCLDVSADVVSDLAQPYGMLTIRNTNRESCAELAETVKSAVTALVENGIDREALSAAIDRYEFRVREGWEPQGLRRNILSLSAWLYGGDPLLYLKNDSIFDKLRSLLDTGHYEKLLSEWLLEEDGRAVLYLLPSHGYGAKQKEDEAARLSGIISGLSADELDELIEQNRILDEWQQSEDTPEALAAMPKLPLSEVSEKPLPFETAVSERDGITILTHPAKKKGIVSVNLYFSAADCSEDELLCLSALDELLGDLPTKKSSGAELRKRMTRLFGSMDCAFKTVTSGSAAGVCRPFIRFSASFLRHNTAEALALIAEILTETSFDNEELIKELLRQLDEDMRQDIIERGQSYAMLRARAALSAEASVNELTGGIESYIRLRNSADRSAQLKKDFAALAGRIFCRKRLTVSITASEETDLSPLFEALPEGTAPSADELKYRLLLPKDEGIVIPSGVSYSGAALSGLIEDRAVWSIVSTVLSYEYLWQEVRIKGGAYGTGANVDRLGEGAFYSYRDPSPDRSLDIFSGAADFLRRYCAGKPDISSYIVSTIGNQEPLMSDAGRGLAADDLYFRGVTEEKRAEERRRMLSLTADDLLSAVPLLENIGTRCVVGSGDAVEACGMGDVVNFAR